MNAKFNAYTTTRIVCRPNCPPGRRTKPQNRRYFGSLKQAYVEGFRVCLVCKPSEGPPGPWLPVKEREKDGPLFSGNN
ncbi:MAG TPA: hypothetical protein DDW46_00450 [Dehalococcoidia bacterium]|nr:hypothetical protein [Dehalococcoidia bacterium]